MQTFVIDCNLFTRHYTITEITDSGASKFTQYLLADDFQRFVRTAGTQYETCKFILTGASKGYLVKVKDDIYKTYDTNFSEKTKNIIVEILKK